MSQQNKAIVRRWLEQVINTKNVDLIDEFLASDHRLHRPGQEVTGIAEAKELVRLYFAPPNSGLLLTCSPGLLQGVLAA